MKAWLSLAELAAARLPGLPATRRGMAVLAERSGWTSDPDASRTRSARGGGLEISVEVLPSDAQAAWISQAANLPGPVAMRLPTADPLTDARGLILDLFHAFARANGLTMRSAETLFSSAYNAGVIEVPAWVLVQVPGFCRRTIHNWRAARETGKLAGLGRVGRPPKADLDGALDGQVKTACLAVMAAKPFVSAKHVQAYIIDRFGADLGRSPSLRDVQRAMARWEAEHRNELTRLRDPDGYRSRIEFAASGSTRAPAVNDLWQIDASPADVMLKGGKRHSIYLAIDIFSRRVIILVTQTPRAVAVGLLIRKCLIAWGVPRTVKTDNGSDFRARSTGQLFAALGVEVELSPPYQPKAKGVVERAIGTFQRDLPTCPGFIGHSVADRKVIENRKAFNRRLWEQSPHCGIFTT